MNIHKYHDTSPFFVLLDKGKEINPWSNFIKKNYNMTQLHILILFTTTTAIIIVIYNLPFSLKPLEDYKTWQQFSQTMQ